MGKRKTHVLIIVLLAACHFFLASLKIGSTSLWHDEIVELSELTKAPLEINLFYYRPEREDAILEALLAAGAKEVFGTHDRLSETIPELSSNRRKVDSEGIAKADVVLVPLEDGDRTEALKAIDKFVITIDLNPMSRTAIFSDITIVDNIVRAAPLMVQYAREMKGWPHEKLDALVADFDNQRNLSRAVSLMKAPLASQIKEDEA